MDILPPFLVNDNDHGGSEAWCLFPLESLQNSSQLNAQLTEPSSAEPLH